VPDFEAFLMKAEKSLKISETNVSLVTQGFVSPQRILVSVVQRPHAQRRTHVKLRIENNLC